MKTFFIGIFFILTFSFKSKATSDCIWITSRSGITIRYIASCSFKKEFLDSILKQTISVLNRQDTSVKILVLINTGRLSFSGAAYSNMLSMGYDTLRQIDDDFISTYYWDKASGGTGAFDTKSNPLDINSTSDKSSSDVGIKIIYDKDYRLGEPNWNEIAKLIVYAANNVDQIKQAQTRDTVRYNSNGWYVSLMTVDTFTLNKILEKTSAIPVAQVKNAEPERNRYFLIGALGLIVVLALLVGKRRLGG